mmetsp:Transcript_14335/g.20854  ORF Transcript_14335/g.20854 Transcript_14335/m.20854 type:complete len:81 (-) Transcript_14335:745-987(-)
MLAFRPYPLDKLAGLLAAIVVFYRTCKRKWVSALEGQINPQSRARRFLWEMRAPEDPQDEKRKLLQTRAQSFKKRKIEPP